MKINHYTLIVTLIIVVVMSGIAIMNVNADRENTVNLSEETKIREVIHSAVNRRFAGLQVCRSLAHLHTRKHLRG